MNPWEMMGQQQQVQQPPQMTVWDYPGVKEAVGMPIPSFSQLPPEQQPQPEEPQQPEQQTSPWETLMGAGYGTYL